MSHDDDFDYEEQEVEREPRTLPDFWIEPDAVCVVCKVQNSSERPMRWVCSECGGATHDECGADTEPSGGWDRDYEINYWVCNNCLKHTPGAFRVLEIGGLTFEYTDHRTLIIAVDGQSRELETDDARQLVAFLHDLRGELFIDDETVDLKLDPLPDPDPFLAGVSSDGGLGDLDLDEHPF